MAHRPILLATAAAVLIAGLGAADLAAQGFGLPPGGAEGGDRRGAIFDRMDLDGDGAVDRDEAAQFRLGIFERLDASGDGIVTQTELVEARQGRPGGAGGGDAGRQDRMGERFLQADRNGDGHVSRDEFLAEDRLFTHLDRDGNGLITRDELPRRAR